MSKPFIKGIPDSEIVFVSVEDAKKLGVSAGWNHVTKVGTRTKYELLHSSKTGDSSTPVQVKPAKVEAPVEAPVAEEVPAEPVKTPKKK